MPAVTQEDPNLLPGADDTGRRRLRHLAVSFAMLAASFLLRGAAAWRLGVDSASNLLAGFALWMAAMALQLLSVLQPRFPAVAAAAARLALLALQEILNLR
ncbi:hypothetical protein ACP4OV_018602 [Aristida adscensionis]